ncbi:glycosyltransferase family protein [Sphingobacterium faecium]|uniref:glycosyltransferase family protein n=1 Tax=Sphingobacterium faecium TaxID=34087 RepID=UPI00246903DF|nr:hypothetical protein [Sphingobacterium faecium]MDH5825349.1 hypothetical protein [Sphingobacterium faecium]
MKICVVSFDFWHYDHYIIDELLKKDISASHINIGNYSYANIFERISNTCSKIFLGKNLKHINRQKYVRDSLESLGHQDQILIMNPHTLAYETIQYIKQHTGHLIAYLYDNLDRFPVQDKLHLFDKVYSFEDEDVKKYGFEKLTNYNYLVDFHHHKNVPELDIFYITSYDKNRKIILKDLVNRFQQLNFKFKIVTVGKKVWKEQLRQFFFPKSKHIACEFHRKPISHTQALDAYHNTRVILDLMRQDQTGLSFRVFEAMALEKKMITNNPSIVHYDFYRPENILVLNDEHSNLSVDFVSSPYVPIPDEIYHKYTLDNWVTQVFNLSEK